MSGINQKPGGSFPYVIRFRFLIHDLAGQWGGPGHVKLSPMRALTDVPPSPVNLLLPWSWQTPEGFALRGWRSPASGKPVLHFIHGTGMCGLTYWPVLEQLLPQVDLFISDLHGHGDSDGQAPFVGWNRSAELALAAWQAHAADYGPVETIAAGHSLGAVISAMMLGSTPGVFNRGLLLDPVIMPPLMRALGWLGERTGLYARNTLAQRARTRRQQWSSRQHARDYLHQRGIFRGWSAPALAAYVDHALDHAVDGRCQLKCPPQIEADIFGSLPQGLWPLLDKVAVPVDVLMGEQSYPFARKASSQWARRNARVRVHSVAGDHCYMQDAPDASAELLRALLSAGAVSR